MSERSPATQRCAGTKVLVTGDLHLNAGHWAQSVPGSGDSAWSSAQRCYLATVKAAIDHGVEAYFMTGDAFRDHRPEAEAVELLADGVRMLVAAGVPVYCFAGNHELVGLAAGHRHALLHLAGISGVTILDEPSVVELASGLQVACVPWPRTAGASGRLGVDASAVEAAVTEELVGVIDCLTAGIDPTRPSMLCGHLLADTVRFGHAPRGSETQMRHEMAEPVVSVAQLDDGPWAIWILSHVHRRQRLGARGWYTGSTERHDKSDEGLEKGASLVSFDAEGAPSMTLVPTPARVFRTIEVDLSDAEAVEALVDNGALDVEGALVSIRWTGSDDGALERVRAACAAAGAAMVKDVAPPPLPPPRREGSGLAATAGLDEALLVWGRRRGLDEVAVTGLLAAARDLVSEGDDDAA